MAYTCHVCNTEHELSGGVNGVCLRQGNLEWVHPLHTKTHVCHECLLQLIRHGLEEKGSITDNTLPDEFEVINDGIS